MADCALPRTARVRSAREFSAVFASRRAVAVGPLVVHAAQTEHAHSRLGLAVPRRAGSAPRRNRIKRMLREAFRLHRHHWPAGWDFVVVVKPHAPLSLQAYIGHLRQAVGQLVGETP